MRHRGSTQASPQLEETALSDANLILLAERELAAFARAVGELFGPEQARLSTADWIDELESLNWPARPGALYFRRITTAASAKLARREPFRLRIKPGSATTSSRSDRV
jgi:hypothetical protein